MKGTRAAQRYAKAIIGLAKDKNATDAVYDDMQSISQTIANSKDLKSMLGSPVVKSGVKKSALREIFKNAHPITLSSFDILVENGRINLLEIVARQYIAMYYNINNTQRAVVTSAVPLTRELEEKVQAKIKELTGNEASIKNIVDEDMIGGFVLRVGDLQYDASVASNLNRLKRELKNNTYVSKFN
ncbi:ATP synthase F1 subunit delta [Salegentibacter sediminis]|uniref:ATP synthase F1 subunit delta n=1 Tax=Salegentibacter sediminis TaxID=1930251 RepID=UPI0009BF3C70|nr:ATP synthase F1 subunit delta [Salegentibacter sediminis]